MRRVWRGVWVVTGFAGCGPAERSSVEGATALACDDAVLGYLDGDGDGFGQGTGVLLRCEDPPPGYATRTGDCDDFRVDVFPDAQEVCGDGVDQDCDGSDLACALDPLVWTIPGDSDDGLGTAVAAVGDVTGDGVSDVAVSGTKASGGAGIVRVFGGPAHPTLGVASRASYAGPLGAMYGTALVALGDIGGDGVADFAWGAPGDGMLGDGGGRVWVGWGPAVADYSGGMGSGLMAGDNGVWGVGAALAGGGDLTGDGVADLVIGAPEGGDWGTYEGRAFVMPLPLPTDHVASVGTDPLMWWGAELADTFGAEVAVVPDRNGDGFAELAVSAPGAADAAGQVYLWHGPLTAGGAAADADEVVTGLDAGHRLGEALLGLDTDADGLAELVVGAPSVLGGRVEVIQPDGARHALVATGLAGIGVAIDGADVDGDGHVDLVVGAPTAADQDGAVAMWWGPLSGTASFEDLEDRFDGTEVAGGLGASVAIHPDWTGDGLPDVLAGAPESGGGAGLLMVISGAAWDAVD